MLNIIPVVLFCAFVPGDINACSATTAVNRHELDPVSTPMECLRVANIDAASYISAFIEKHPNKTLDYRIICKSGEKT